MNWYLNQKIVCVKPDPIGYLKKNEEYAIHGISKNPCCGRIVIDVGIRTHHELMECLCGAVMKNKDVFSETRFAPLDVDISELTEILTKEIENV